MLFPCPIMPVCVNITSTQYRLHIIATLLDALSIGTRTIFFWSASRQLMTSIYFRIGLDLDGLILVLSFRIFLSTFVKIADFQGIKDSSDIFLSDNNFPFSQIV